MSTDSDDHYVNRLIFPSDLIRDWFFDIFGVLKELEGPATIGSGPFDEDEFDKFLRCHSIKPKQIGEGTDLLVIGQYNWDISLISQLLKDRRGKTLRVYSQEMYLMYWVSGVDPLDQSQEALSGFMDGHPGLQYINSEWHDWPTTDVPAESSGDLDAPWPQIGLLLYLGYRVGAKGIAEAKRRAILRRVFEDDKLPNVESPEYMSEWGEAQSHKRLMKMANSIASFCRNSRRRAKPATAAIEEWESDLAWLRNEFYDGRFNFFWPSTED